MNKWRDWFKTPSGSMLTVFGVATAVFTLFYPTHFLIADELAYFEQASSWAGGRTFFIDSMPCSVNVRYRLPGAYPAGTALLATGLTWIGGLRAVFWSSFLCWLLGTWAIGRLLLEYRKPWIWALYPWLFLPALALTRTLMSDIPSFALAGLFLLLLTKPGSNRTSIFVAGFVAGLAFLFRETNLIWAIPFLIGAWFRKIPFQMHLWSGFGTGLLMRGISAWFLMGDPFFYKNPDPGFSWSVFPQNLIFYMLLLSVFVPGGWWFLWKSKWRYRGESAVVLLLFLIVFGSYGYDALTKSGYKGLVLQGRFLIPLLPVLAISAAHGPERLQYLLVRYFKVLPVIALLAFGGVQIAGHWYNNEQMRINDLLYSLPVRNHVSFTPDESRKFINGLHDLAISGQPTLPSVVYSGLHLRPEQLDCDSVWFVHAITRRESADHKNKSEAALAALEKIGGRLDPMHEVELIDGTKLQTWKMILAPTVPHNPDQHNHEQIR